MKTILTVAVMMLFVLAVGTAYADDVPVFGGIKDVGTELYNDAFAAHDSAQADADKEVKGSATGGVAKEDENSKIWDDLLRPTGETEAP